MFSPRKTIIFRPDIHAVELFCRKTWFHITCIFHFGYGILTTFFYLRNFDVCLVD